MEVFGSWNSWKKSEILSKCGANKVREVVLELEEGNYEYKFLVNKKDWKSNPKKDASYSGNHTIKFESGENLRFHANLEGLRKTAAHYRHKYADYRQYYAYRDGNIVFLMRESK